MRNARVFISCGQRTFKEKEIGLKVDGYFKKRGFDTFFAEKAHSPEALTEYIFKYLERSEYFLFIDFERERLARKSFRGSLFVGQEIAIATYLKIPGFGFYEARVKREGILNYQIYNAQPFSTIGDIIKALDEQTKDWDSSSINELRLAHIAANDAKDYAFIGQPDKPHGDWWLLEVQNRHKRKHAFSCLAYIARIDNIETGQRIPIPTLELIWTGLGEHTVNILADSSKEVDAFYVLHDKDVILFNTRRTTTTNPRYLTPILPKGLYRLEYLIAASNFPTTSRGFILDYRGARQEIRFGEEPTKPAMNASPVQQSQRTIIASEQAKALKTADENSPINKTAVFIDAGHMHYQIYGGH